MIVDKLKLPRRVPWAATAKQLLREYAPAVAPFCLPFLVYLLTAAPTIYNLDSAELTTAAATGGIIRATGYPLYLIIGRFWSLLPVGDVGFRMNLLSAFSGALTILLADRILLRMSVRGWARFGTLGLLATAPYFWSLSLIAEVYTLHTCLMAAVVLALLRWSEALSPGRLFLPVLLLGLSMGNHSATVLLVPGAVWYVIVSAPQTLRRGKSWLAVLVALLSAGAIFLYLPWVYGSQPAFNYAGVYNAQGVFEPVNLRTTDGLLWLLTGRSFAGQMFAYRLGEIWYETRTYGIELWTAFFAIGIGPGLLGLGALLRKNWRLGTMLLLLFAANAIFYINYRVVDKNTMFLPTYLVWALWLGFGYQTLLDWMADAGRAQLELRVNRFRIRLRDVGIAAWALRILMLLAVFVALSWNWQRVDLSDDWSTRRQSEQILRLAEPNALVFGWWETVPAVQYLQLVEGRRPDVQAINRFLISGPALKELIVTQAPYRPVYIDSPPLDLIQTMNISKVGQLYRLEPRRATP